MSDLETVCIICDRLFEMETGAACPGDTGALRERLHGIYLRLESTLLNGGCSSAGQDISARAQAIRAMMYASRDLPYEGLDSWIGLAEETVAAWLEEHTVNPDGGMSAGAADVLSLIALLTDGVEDTGGCHAQWRLLLESSCSLWLDQASRDGGWQGLPDSEALLRLQVLRDSPLPFRRQDEIERVMRHYSYMICPAAAA